MSLADLLRDTPRLIGQDMVSSCVPVQHTVTPKFASTLAEAMNAPALVLKLTPKVTSISSGLLAMLRSFSTTDLVAGRTLLRASSKVSLAFSMVSSLPARTVPPVSGSSTSTTMLPPLPGDTQPGASSLSSVSLVLSRGFLRKRTGSSCTISYYIRQGLAPIASLHL
jgi:hypothetical protein